MAPPPGLATRTKRVRRHPEAHLRGELNRRAARSGLFVEPFLARRRSFSISIRRLDIRNLRSGYQPLPEI
jgi:hypothetical protein